MLSAIAARKAAQAANGPPISVAERTPVPSDPVTPPSPLDSLPNHARPNSKRKSSSQTPNSSRKRKKKREAELKKPRYFAAESNPLPDSDDVIIIDSDDEDVSDAPRPPPVTRTTVAGKRVWSPSAPINDSSDEEREEIADVPIPLAPHRATATHGPPQTLTSFRVRPGQTAFYLDSEETAALGLSADSATLIALSQGETVSLLGAYMFTVLQGAVSICGVRTPAAAAAHRVFAPRSSPIPALEALNEKVRLDPVLAVPPRLRPAFENSGTLVAFHQLNSGVEGLGRVCRTFNGVFKPSRFQQDIDANHDLRVAGAHMLSQPSKDIQSFILPASWEVALNSVSESTNGVYLIKGHKKSGKSTFARTLLNRLLCRYRKVAYLECDLGQSEFTPAGLVALNIVESPVFGPPFTHPSLPNFAHYIGMTTPRSSPAHYLASIQSLVETYQLDVQTPVDYCNGDSRISDTIPLIVNTMGWTKGLGADLTRQIEDIVQPSAIFEVEAPFFEYSSSFEPPPSVFDVSQGAKSHLLQPIVPSVLATNYSAADHRSIAILSYFHAIFPRMAPKGLQQVTAATWNTILPLCAHPPYEVDWSLAFDKITLSGAGTEDVVPSELNRVLNGALVGLVAYEPGSLENDIDMTGSSSATIPVLPYTQGSPAPSPSTSTCHGIALIRAMSPSSPHLHLITPLPPHLLSKCRVLVKGEMELPLWGMLDFRSELEGEVGGVEKGKVPYLQWGKGEGLGGEKRRVRRNLMRRGQM
ncbi:hypothetical protein C8F04DRAFT_943495 [Mycena alexandri]|uniref:Polynucleotide 5'-hydroxyl-kinase GRC3 n=1 Tax=Mycena alexandri TaxID=1745969 RepID=A0AAD6TE35_9AGAR|nr:hypothetical protein C8F04DRAFT_943495 [Mycena alexandri]